MLLANTLTFAEIVYFIIPLVIASMVPLTLVAVGALYSERSGVVNIALEGIMLMGAYVGAVVIKRLEIVGVSPVYLIFISILAGLFFGYVLLIATQFLLDYVVNNLLGKELDLDSPKLKQILYFVYAVISIGLFYLILVVGGVNVQVAIIGLLVGAVIGTIFSALHAFAAINMKANQIISATALNMFAPAFAIFVNRTFSENGTQKVTIQESYRIPEVGALANIPSIGGIVIDTWYLVLLVFGVIFLVKYGIDRLKEKNIQDTLESFKNFFKKPVIFGFSIYVVFVSFVYLLTKFIGAEGDMLHRFNDSINLEIGNLFFSGAYLSTFIGLVVFITLVLILYKSKFGLRLRSCGENPQAADSLGINIFKIRYAGVLISGALAGMGGVIFVLSFAANFNATVSGFGFLALAVLIFGNWNPKRILLAALFFAFMRVIANTYSVIPFLNNLDLEGELYSMLPYLATLIVLAFVSKNSAAPRAAGEPYDPGKR